MDSNGAVTGVRISGNTESQLLLLLTFQGLALSLDEVNRSRLRRLRIPPTRKSEASLVQLI